MVDDSSKLDHCKKFWTIRFFLILVVGSLIGAVSSNTLNLSNYHPQVETLKELKQTDKHLEQKIESNTEKINQLQQDVNE